MLNTLPLGRLHLKVTVKINPGILGDKHQFCTTALAKFLQSPVLILNEPETGQRDFGGLKPEVLSGYRNHMSERPETGQVLKYKQTGTEETYGIILTYAETESGKEQGGNMLSTIISTLNSIIWSDAMIVVCLGAGLFFSIRYKFAQIRDFKDMLRNLISNKSSEDGISTFASFCTTMSARLGVGNIAGVATAVYMGGPGAIFWMWMTSFLIAATSYTECTLGQLYKIRIDGQYRGGAYYIAEKAFGWRWYAYIFCFASILGLVLLTGTQANQISESVSFAFGISPVVTGVILGVIIGIIILGGIRRVSNVASVLVPFMAIAYFVVTIIILIANASMIPTMFKWIFQNAFTMDAAFGATVGTAIIWGVKRAVFASGSGMGEETPAASAAETSHPAGQGLANSFGIYVDILVCTCSGLLILVTDCFNTATGYVGSGSAQMQELFDTGQYGIVFQQAAVDSVMPAIGKIVVCVILVLFALTSVLSYAYQVENTMAYLFVRASEKLRKNVLLCTHIFMVIVFIYFSTQSSDTAWAAGDVGVGLMIWFNMFLIILLHGKAVKLLRDYEAQRKLGILYPVFDPDKLGIKNADLWKEINKDLIGKTPEELKAMQGVTDK